MLKALFPKAHVRFSSLPLLGSIVDSFTEWLQQQGYRRRCSRILVRTLARVDAMIRQRGRSALRDVTREDLQACRPTNSQETAIWPEQFTPWSGTWMHTRLFHCLIPIRRVEARRCLRTMSTFWQMFGDSPVPPLQDICARSRIFSRT